ncbi:MAG: AMP-binding protein, partial [Clostridia bacterium]|nr:AMP-binding protein [Clostridia bacterium]
IIPVFLHMPYTEHDLSYILELTGTRALAIMRQYRGRDYLHMAQELRRRFPHVQHVVSVGGGADAVDFEELIARPKQTPASRLEELRPTGVDPFFIMFTSGTTGRPKAELHLHANNLAWIRSFSSVHHFPADAHWIIVTPIAHLTGFGLGVLSALKRGAPFTLLTAWDVHRCIELVERDQPTFLLGAPPMLIDIARYPDLEARNVRSLKTICYAGAPCPAEILNTLNRRLGAEIIAFYGYTEGGVTHCTQPGDPLEITSTSLGKLAPGVEQRFVDEDGNIVEPPCEAEIWCRGPSFIPGYFGQPETTRRLFTPDGWYKSGDIIRMDANGYGYFVARKDDLINRGGYKIDPREIEEVLYRHPRVAQAAVVAMPDERLGQRACAFIVPKETGDVLTLADITGFLEAQGVSRVKWPEAVEMVDAFPMTSTGKFMRYALRERARELKPQR